jgi:F0F1-type ATP synthase assembly protein I
MSETESIKANIAFHEKIFFAAIATLMTLIGWIVSNYTVTNSILLVVALAIGFFSGGFVIYQYRLIKRLIKELENV